MNKKLSFACIATFLVMILLGPVPGTAAENIKQVALFPFEVHSTSLQKAAELQEILYRGVVSGTSEIEKPSVWSSGNRSTPVRKGNGSTTPWSSRWGKRPAPSMPFREAFPNSETGSASMSRLIDLREEKVLPGVFVQGRGRENLDAILAQLRTDILLRIASDERIARIEFKGNRKIEASAINQVLKSAPGNIFTDADLSADIKAIFKMGYFDDVTAEVTDVAEGKVITFIVEEKPLITEIRIQGNKAVKKDDIEGAMSVRTRQTVNPEKLKADMEKIKALYDSKGFYNAEIRYTIEKGANGTSTSSSPSSKTRSSSSGASASRATGPSPRRN